MQRAKKFSQQAQEEREGSDESDKEAYEETLLKLVRIFYSLVDIVSLPHHMRHQVPELVADAHNQIKQLFEDATYLRCDRAAMEGAAIANYYQNERHLIGRHSLSYIHAKNTTVVVAGTFIPVLGDSIKFCDLWHFRKDGSVKLRETYIGAAAYLIDGNKSEDLSRCANSCENEDKV